MKLDMKKGFSKKILFIALCVCVQLVILWIIIGKYSYVVVTWTEIIVKTRGYDPRDLFRWEYVSINYDISSYTGSNYQSGLCEGGYGGSRGKQIFVVPSLDEKNYVRWIEKIVSDKIFLEEWKLAIKAKISRCSTAINISYEKDRFFIKEWTGKPLENKLRDNEIESYAVRKVAKNGDSLLSHLLVDGEIVK